MKPFVVAVVVVHDEPVYFSATLAALKSQSRPVDRIIILDTSTNDDSSEIANSNGISELHKLPANYSLQQSLTFANKLIATNSVTSADWVWLLHDDSAPKHDALAEMLRAIEQSPSVAIAAPKLVDWQNEKLVSQLGLTLTPFGDLFSIVNNQLDQSQHDELDDVMAVGTAASLIRLDVLTQLQGLDPSAPPLAADFDFSIRVRMAGHRVIVVPQAKVAHAGLAMNGQRNRKWLGSNPKTALRRAAIHLRLAYAPLPLAILFWLLLPAVGVVRAIGRIASKRPDRIWSELSSAAWGFLTVGARFASRANIARTRVVKFSKLKALRASWQQVRNANLASLEREQSQATLAAFARGEFDVEHKATAKGFVASGALWVATALTVLSVAYWPLNNAAVGGGLLPLSDAWLSLFSRAGASFQPIGLGYFGPSDPFVWVLATLGSFTFWAPSLSLALILLFAKAIAFSGAWRVVSLISDSSFVRISTALIFAFWPALTLAQQEARIPAVIAQVCLPWLVFTVARAADIGKRNYSTQTWSWVAVAGLLFFIVSASAPNTIAVLIVAFALVVFARIRKIGFLIWIPLPAAAIFGPTVLYYLVSIFKPLALLADPGLPQQSAQVTFWQLILGGQTFGAQLPWVGQVSGWVIVPVVLLALVALLTKRWANALVVWLGLILALASAWLVSGFSFAAVGVGSSSRSTDFVNGSPAVLLGLVGLLMAALVAITLNEVKSPKFSKVVGAFLLVTSLAPSLVVFAITKPEISYSTGRVVPSIVAAEAAQGSALKLLVINPEVKQDGAIQFGAEIVSGDGVQLEDVSLSYRFALASVKEARADEYETLSQLVADLASANGSDLQSTIDKAGVGYVLVPDQTSAIASQLAIALDSVKELESVGSTDFGQLWRVQEPNQELLNAKLKPTSPWSITKAVQLTILLGFVLLAIPSVNQRRRVSGDSEIFVEEGAEN